MMSMRRAGSVCRSLFGPVDHDQLRVDLELNLQEIAEQDSRRWNFNFQSGTPLRGSFEWEVFTDRQECAQPQSACSSPNTAERSREERAVGTDTCSRSPAEGTPVRLKRSKPAADPRITEFFSKRRRSTETRSVCPQHTQKQLSAKH
ncbi:cyclin-dependent kinase inhibitor 1B [Nematolebias whitei]|uniref:cyclin-dependent kinase inhibitor 1B n=1 Tax=Nematolebias whitei TaxID=451745 RepID=UPI00189B2A32|nr:cyclin-dependent kinase inhibitor 1B [Nematolebias whitei]